MLKLLVFNSQKIYQKHMLWMGFLGMPRNQLYKKNVVKNEKSYKRAASAGDPTLESPVQGRKSKQMKRAGSHSDNTSSLSLTRNEDMGSSVLNHQIQHNSGQEPAASDNVSPNGSLGIHSGSSLISKDVALPRVVLCLAHNGKVAWDIKWRPYNVSEFKFKHRMGYLAALLGNGSLEV